MSALDKEFLALCQAKIDAAGKMLEEVNTLLAEKGETLNDVTQDYPEEPEDENEEWIEEPLLNIWSVTQALDNAGWSTSSMRC